MPRSLLQLSHRRLQLLSVLVLVALLSPLATLLVHAQQDVTVADVLITSVSGCTDESAITISCPTPASLAIRTDQPLTYLSADTGGMYNYHISVVATCDTLTAYSYVRLDPSDATNRTLLANIEPNRYNPAWSACLVQLHLYDNSIRQSSAPSAGFRYAYDPPPTLLSISGCDGNGTATLHCDPHSNTLTLTGYGLRWVRGNTVNRANVTLGDNSEPGMYLQWRGDTAIDIVLTYTPSIVLPVHYNGTLLPIYFSIIYTNASTGATQLLSTNSLTVSFIPQPPPVALSWYMSGCTAPTGNTTWYTDCVSGWSWVVFNGRYLYNMTVEVAGERCIPNYWYSTQYVCWLPFMSSYPAGRVYDMVAYNELGSVNKTALFSFSSQPSLITTVACVDVSVYSSSWPWSSWPFCAAGDVFVLRGSQLYADPAMRVVITASSTFSGVGDGGSVDCLDPQLINVTAMSCTLPEVMDDVTRAALTDGLGNVTVIFPTLGTSASLVVSYIYRSPLMPLITAVSGDGCGTSLRALELSLCYSGGVITLIGSNLLGSKYSMESRWQAGLVELQCADHGSSSSVVRVNGTTLVCVLPLFDAVNDTGSNVQLGVAYRFQLTVTPFNATRGDESNVVVLTFALDEPFPPYTSTSGSDESSSLSSGAIAGVVVGVLLAVVLVAATLLVIVRRRSGHHNGSRSTIGWKRQTASRQDERGFGSLEM